MIYIPWETTLFTLREKKKQTYVSHTHTLQILQLYKPINKLGKIQALIIVELTLWNKINK